MNTSPLNLAKYDIFDALNAMGDDELQAYLEDLNANETFLREHHGYHDLYDEEFDPELDEFLSSVGC